VAALRHADREPLPFDRAHRRRADLSLIVELQFYALLPFVAYGLARLARRSRRNAAVRS